MTLPDSQRTAIVGIGISAGQVVPLRSVQIDDVMVERAARKLATDFGYEDVFRAADAGEMVEDNYDADYWRMLSRNSLEAALSV